MKPSELTPEEVQEQQSFLEGLHFSLDDKRADVLNKALELTEQVVRSHWGSNAERRRLLRSLIRVSGCKPATAGTILTMLDYVTTLITTNSHSNSAEELQDFLLTGTKDEISDVERGRLAELLHQLFASAGKFREIAKTSVSIRGVTPMFTDISATLELRSTQSPLVFEEEIDQKSSAELLPIASVCLSVDSGEPSELCFQVTVDQAEVLIEELQRLRDGMIQLKNGIDGKTK